jgi:hypothetical protein
MRTGNLVRVIDETERLLGTAGTLYWHGDYEDDFMTAYTDTFSNEFFSKINSCVKSFKVLPENIIAGIISMNSLSDGSGASVNIDCIGTVESFSEKKKYGNVSWAGIMFAKKQFYSEIKESDRDLAYNVLPKLYGRMRVICHVDAYDIGRGVSYYERFNRKFHQEA